LRNANNTHFSTHSFDWLKFAWNPSNLYGIRMIWWDSCKFKPIKDSVFKCVLLAFFKQYNYIALKIIKNK